jgi:hypothetical protein
MTRRAIFGRPYLEDARVGAGGEHGWQERGEHQRGQGLVAQVEFESKV